MNIRKPTKEDVEELLKFKVKAPMKKTVEKMLLVEIIVNVILGIIMAVTKARVLETIVVYIVTIYFIVLDIVIIKLQDKVVSNDGHQKFENKYDPILTQVLAKNDTTIGEPLVKAEIAYLIRKGRIGYDESTQKYYLKEVDKYPIMDSFEKIDEEKIEEYSTDGIPSYERLFVRKILFAFDTEISKEELTKNIREGYYTKRGELCEYVLEKMLLHEINKRGMTGSYSIERLTLSVETVLNMLSAIILFILIGRVNIFLIAALLANIGLSIIIMKNENLIGYSYSEETLEYISDLENYLNFLKSKKASKNITITQSMPNIELKQEININENEENESDKELKLLFEIEK